MPFRIPQNLVYGLLGLVIGVSYTASFFYLAHPAVDSQVGGSYQEKWKLLDHKLQKKISRINRKDSSLSDLSIHLHDLNTGLEIRYNDEAHISGGSLLKLPLVMGQLKYAEENSDYLSQKIPISNDKYDELYGVQTIESKKRLRPGKFYTVGQLVSKSIIDSDNVASVHLEKLLNNEPLRSVAARTNINLEDGKLTIKSYSGIFKSLYHATYLSPESSHTALSLLTRSDFSKGLRAGVPDHISVAHKFGQKFSADNDQVYFNHCGIIYIPRHPYVLCVSTLGKNSSLQIENVEKISATVFKEISKI